MKPLKVLILATYFNRPLLVRNALHSIRKANEHYTYWQLVFGDDNSLIPGEPIVRTVLGNLLSQIVFIRSNSTIDEKLQKGILLGMYANQIIMDSDADIAITLADDDELVPVYLRDLANYFSTNPEVMYCYSHVHLYNPTLQVSNELTNVVGHYNSHTIPVNPVNLLDTSQVAFRLDCFRNFGVRYPESTLGTTPWINNIDASLFQQLYDKFGPCPFTGLVAQYKGIHDYQLIWHKKGDVKELRKYMEKVELLGGERF